MSIKVAYITTARSDYGPSYWVLHDLFADKRFEVLLIVAGSHLSQGHGLTVQEIEKDGWPIAARIPFLDESGKESSSGMAAGHALGAFAEFFASQRPDIAVVYGDRFELLPIASAAVITGTPLAHLCGGDITEGAIDDQVRHAVTKMAHLHFPCSQRSAERILQMGEEPWRVHMVGDPSLDHFVRGAAADAAELSSTLGFLPDRNTLLVTFHPVTLELEQMEYQAQELAAALSAHDGHVIITAPAPDPGSQIVRSILNQLAQTRPNTVFVESLGSRGYRGVMKLVGAMVGNSSSGLSEASCVPLPVVNIGNRQKGRDRAANVLDAAPVRDNISDGIRNALSPEFRTSLANIQCSYGDGQSTPRIVKALSKLPNRAQILRKKFIER